jgi:X-linked retinitis pigmentosa GTPase regulator
MKTIAAGSFSAAISQESGDLYLWGSGIFGEFLTPHRVKTIKSRAIEVSIGNHFGQVVTDDGNVYSWGHNSFGELGSGDLKEKATPQLNKALLKRKVFSISTGKNFVIALGETLPADIIQQRLSQAEEKLSRQ